MKIKWKKPFKSPKVAVDPLIVKGNKIILLRRAIEPFKGKLEFPGGMVEYGETVEHAVVREAEEEIGLKIKLNKIPNLFFIYYSLSMCIHSVQQLNLLTSL